ncbi:hypothetical protein [Agaribacter marinus]|uniref:Uncharacterized protein n=1 Tax=Agaribacter marinus TaxID=1431249 RepID=A0AA37WMK9_9ALTE|nr:hypothetical protein [Agaribacter marinus]GLR72875.1 hypothetical protein GCM10007852_37830 [Agaribacter marinus]
MLNRYFISCLLLILPFTLAAQEQLAVYGDDNQPGTRIHKQILGDMDAGASQNDAVSNTIDIALEKNATILSAEAKSTVALDKELSASFFQEMLLSNSLIDAVKVLSELNAGKVVQVVTLAVQLYPNFAQEAIDGATLAGVIPAQDALLVALQAGADPSTITEAAAAGGEVTTLIAPLGAGTGAGGTGGGDTTASTN